MKKTIFIILSVFIGLVAIVAIVGFIRFNFTNGGDIVPSSTITNFEECVAAGNPAMESYPRQCRANNETFVEIIAPISAMTETEAKLIAESTCIKGGETLASGIYNEGTKTWWFDANLNGAREGCNPACVVSEETRTAEINWRCTGLAVPKASTVTIQALLVQKYPQYPNLTININQETENHARGSVIFETGAPGGIFLAAKVNDIWQIVFDGNGQIPCSLSSYGFPDEMLVDCSER